MQCSYTSLILVEAVLFGLSSPSLANYIGTQQLVRNFRDEEIHGANYFKTEVVCKPGHFSRPGKQECQRCLGSTRRRRAHSCDPCQHNTGPVFNSDICEANFTSNTSLNEIRIHKHVPPENRMEVQNEAYRRFGDWTGWQPMPDSPHTPKVLPPHWEVRYHSSERVDDNIRTLYALHAEREAAAKQKLEHYKWQVRQNMTQKREAKRKEAEAKRKAAEAALKAKEEAAAKRNHTAVAEAYEKRFREWEKRKQAEMRQRAGNASEIPKPENRDTREVPHLGPNIPHMQRIAPLKNAKAMERQFAFTHIDATHAKMRRKMSKQMQNLQRAAKLRFMQGRKAKPSLLQKNSRSGNASTASRHSAPPKLSSFTSLNSRKVHGKHKHKAHRSSTRVRAPLAPKHHQKQDAVSQVTPSSMVQEQVGQDGYVSISTVSSAHFQKNKTEVSHFGGRDKTKKQTSTGESLLARSNREALARVRKKKELEKSTVNVNSSASARHQNRHERALLSARSSTPQFVNPSFEVPGTTTTTYNRFLGSGWTRYGNAIMAVRQKCAHFDGQDSSSGQYFIAVMSSGDGLWQGVDGHTVGGYYRLVFSTGHRTSAVNTCPDSDPCTMDVYVLEHRKSHRDTTPTVRVTTQPGMQWYEIAYVASAEKMYFAFVVDLGTGGGQRAVYLDDIGIRVVTPWTILGTDHFVLLQKVACDDESNPTKETCPPGDYVNAGQFDADGVSPTELSGLANENSIWIATEHCHTMGEETTCSRRYSFRAKSLRTPSTLSGATTNWYLDSGYTACSVKNILNMQTGTFLVQANDMGFYTLADEGVKCGFMFLIQKWEVEEMSFAR